MADNKYDFSGLDDEETTEGSQYDFSGLDDEKPSFISKLTQNAKDRYEDLVLPVAKTALDVGRGFSEGALMGGADELAGALSGGLQYGVDKIMGDPSSDVDKQLEAQGFKVENLPDQGIMDYYRQGQQDASKKFKQSAEDSPFLNTTAQLAGAVGSGIMAGNALGSFGNTAKVAPKLMDIYKNSGALKAGAEFLKRGGTSYLQASPLIAAEGALSSEGNLIGGTPEEQSQVGEDVLGSLAFGIPTVLGLQGLGEVVDVAGTGVKKLSGKMDNFVESQPFLRQLKVSKQYGEKGINPKSEAQMLNTKLGETSLSELDNVRAQQLSDEILSADKELGRAVGDSLNIADAAGVKLNLTEPVSKSIRSLETAYDIFEDISQSSRGKQIYDKILNHSGESVSPLEAKSLLDDVDAFIGRFEASKNRTASEEAILRNLQGFRKNLSGTLKTEIPGFKEAASRFEEFRRLVPETIMSGSTPRDISQVYMGDLRNAPVKLFNNIKKLVQGATREGSANTETRTAFVNSMKGMKQFEMNDAARKAAGSIENQVLKRPVADIEKQVKSFADDAVARQAAQTLEERTTVGNKISTIALGSGESVRAKLLSGANLYGRAKQPLAKLSKKMYAAPNELLMQYADVLDNAGLKNLGNSLRQGLESGDSAKKNAALFTIMQNPNARLLFGTEEE